MLIIASWQFGYADVICCNKLVFFTCTCTDKKTFCRFHLGLKTSYVIFAAKRSFRASHPVSQLLGWGRALPSTDSLKRFSYLLFKPADGPWWCNPFNCLEISNSGMGETGKIGWDGGCQTWLFFFSPLFSFLSLCGHIPFFDSNSICLHTQKHLSLPPVFN